MNDLYETLDEKKKKAGTESSKESSLKDWFGRKGEKGSKKGWVDCNAPDGKGGYKSCGRSDGEKRSKYPACRPTPGACKERGKGKSWGKKGKSKKNEELYMNLEQIIQEELEMVLSEKEGKKDACYHKVKSRYKVWPSAYASGALVKCRKVGAKNWGNSKKEQLQAMVEDELTHLLEIEEETLEEKKNSKCTKVTKKASSTRKGKKWMKCVKSDSGGYKRIHWGQAGVRVTGKSGNTKRKKSFKARHGCKGAKSNTPKGQACKDWAE